VKPFLRLIRGKRLEAASIDEGGLKTPTVVADVKKGAAERWVAAVNAEASYGQWRYTMLKKTTDVPDAITGIVSSLTAEVASH
jgi:hypothetical protein